MTAALRLQGCVLGDFLTRFVPNKVKENCREVVAGDASSTSS